MLALFKPRLLEVLRAVAPLVATVTALQIALVDAPAALFLQFLAGSALAALGMVLLFVGIDLGILPMGRFIGAELPRKGSLSAMLGVAFALGAATTIAEPDVLVLAGEVERVSDGGVSSPVLVYVIAGGVGAFTAVGVFRIVSGVSMALLVAGVFASMILLSFLTPAHFVPLAYDAGSVTTGVLTAPVVLALALGLSSVLAGRSTVSDGFGLLGLASAGAVIAVLLAGMILA